MASNASGGAEYGADRIFEAISAEKALLGSLMVEPDAIADVSALVRPEQFSSGQHRDIYQAILDCWEQRIPPDFINVDEQLAVNRAQFATLADLSNIALRTDFTAVYAMHYAQRVVFAHRFRVMLNGIEGATKMLAESPDLDPVDAMQAIIGKMLSGDAATSTLYMVSGLMPTMLQTLDEEQRGIVELRPVPTPYGSLTNLLSGGFKPGELILLAARPSMGKTALALGLAAGAAIYGQSLFFSLEMDTDSVMRRLLSAASGVPHDDIQQAKMSPQQFDAVATAGRSLAKLPLGIDDSPNLTADQIKLRIQRQQAFGPVSLVVIDYLELVGDQHENEERRLTSIARKMKQATKECGVPIVLLSQLSRDVERRTPPVPRLSDLRWSGSLEAIADKIMFIYREDYYLDKGMVKIADRQDEKNVAQIRLDKNRNGSTGRVKLFYDGPKMAFHSLTAQDYADQQAFDVIDVPG